MPAPDATNLIKLVERDSSEKRQIVEALETDSSVRQIWEPLSFNRSRLRLHEFRGDLENGYAEMEPI